MSGKTENTDELKQKFTEEFKAAAFQMTTGYIMTMLTDQFDIQRIETVDLGNEYLKNLFLKALEIRMFNTERETKWFRSSIDKKLQCRGIIDTDNMNELTYWDELQYLDIDETKSNAAEGKVCTTGGGRYSLPVDDYRDIRIRVRNYLSYEEDTMQLQISDWRLVEFVSREK